MYGYPDFYDVQQQHHFQKCTIWWAVIVAILTTIIFMAISSCNQTPARANELTASWYSVESLKKEGTYKYSKGVMANGEVFNNSLMVCATRLYSLGSLLRIQNITTGRSVTVRVTDRIGKRFATKRIDLSKRAFSEIADLKQGIVSVKIEIIELAKQ